MEILLLNSWLFWILIVPGFLTVWVFRYFHKSNKIGEFEYAGLSIVWGLLLFALIGLLEYLGILRGLDKVHLDNQGEIFGLAIILSFLGIIFGWAGSFIADTKTFKSTIDYIKPENIKKKRPK